MLLEDHKSKILNYLSQGETLLNHLGDRGNAEEIRAVRREAEERESPVIMFYGLYNAGKSTLINALCAERVARVNVIPTTKSLQAISWEGYTLLDTPGIQATDEDTKVAVEAIERSDLILFVMDNADTFDNAVVYQEMVNILRTGKALAGVLNQKNVPEDEFGVDIAEQKSIQRILRKISQNLEVQGTKSGLPNIHRQANFLRFFPVNAKDAEDAIGMSPEDAEVFYQGSGIYTLKNEIDLYLKQTAQVQMLMTPLLRLKEILRSAKENYQNSPVLGEKKQLADARDQLTASRQRLQEMLLAKGLLTIEGTFERVKTAVMNDEPIDGEGERLQAELEQLLTEATAQEQGNWKVELKSLGITEAPANIGSSESDTPQLPSAIKSLAVGGALLPVAPEVGVLIVIATAIIRFLRQNQEELEAQRAARESAERLAAYYKQMNELRDQEAAAKASYEKTVRDVLHKCYDSKLEAIEHKLSQANSVCAQYTKNLRALDELQLLVGEEIAALSVQQ